MATEADKENIADGLFAPKPMSASSPAKKGLKKSRSLSMGPGALNAPLKEDTGNRRKSAFIPGVKSILSGQEDDAAKRREARRKSLANRRVSFAPEATLHTWDVIEYMRDATTSSSASSENTRRASSITQNSTPRSPAADDDAEPPSTPPEQVEEKPEEGTPDNQRDLHQRKNRRRSSGIPPMNFNNPEDMYSSSPVSGVGSSPASEEGIEEPGSDSDAEDTAMSLVEPEDVTGRSMGSSRSEDSTSSSARLDEALLQATVHAGNQQLDDDPDGEMSMEIAGDEVTNAFKAFANRNKRDSIGLRKLSAMQDQENVNPFLPSKEIPRAEEDSEDDQTQDMSMDMTHVMGGILPRASETVPETEQNGTKRRRLSTNTTSEGSPAKRPPTRRSSIRRRRSSATEMVADEETMDFTMAVGGLKQQANPRRDSAATLADGDTMDFTMVQGGILTANGTKEKEAQDDEGDSSMELTTTLDKTIKVQSEAALATPSPAGKKATTPTRSPRKSSRKSPRKSLAPLVAQSPRVVDLKTAEAVETDAIADDIQVLATPQKDLPLATPIHFSPLKEIAAKAHTLADSIKLLSTPRKQSSVSPVKKAALTPKKLATPNKTETPKKAITPKRVTPRKRVRMAEQEEDATQEEVNARSSAADEVNETEKIHLQDFLNMTNIRFMDLTTTKRRHTGFPGADRNLTHELDDQEEETPSLESNVAAAVGTLPLLSMYQHMCHEMKNYISGGRDELRTLETEVYESQPPLFKEYMSAPPDERNIMDNQFRNMKTNARLQSKAGWHAWRAQLLGELKKGLAHNAVEFNKDGRALSLQEDAIKASLPDLEARHDDLASQAQLLQQRADEESSYNREELEAARENLVAKTAELEEKQRLLAQLQAELSETESRIEDVKERKTECLEEIKEAERVREECRGWSTSEVAELKEKVDAFEAEHGWNVVAASSSPNTLTLSYLNDLELFLHPASFETGEDAQPNAPISLSYIGEEQRQGPTKTRPLTTSKRFFLQLLRAHLFSTPQCQVPIASVLKTISSTWQTALSVTEAIRILSQSSVTEELILSDERMAVDVMLLLGSLQTKVRIRFEIAAAPTTGDDGEGAISTSVKVDVKVVYGEKYDQPKMGEFLGMWTGGKVGSMEDVAKWSEGVEDLRVRLLKRGKKGERVA